MGVEGESKGVAAKLNLSHEAECKLSYSGLLFPSFFSSFLFLPHESAATVDSRNPTRC